MNRLDQLKERLTTLEYFKIQELASNNPSQKYMSDLQESIKYVTREIKFYKDKPAYEMVTV